jgi:acyl carrier protein
MALWRIWRYSRKVKNRCLNRDLLLSHLKHLVVDILRLDILEPNKIASDESLMGGNLCLDSLDALELAICVEEEFGVAICGGKESPRVFTNIASLADFICAGARTIPAGPPRAAKTNGADESGSVTTASPSVWRPVFASGAMLNF